MPPKHKTFEIKVVDRRKDGGRIIISTGGVDRDRDRVMPRGARLDNYLKNPVVQWGHNYFDPFATIGRSNSIEISDEGIIADFDLRPAANEHDPQNIILLLWNGEWIRTASIGFQPEPEQMKPNDFGGLDFGVWELLEWSIVPIPANQDALRLAAEAHPKAFPAYQKAIAKRGRVLSAKNEEKIKQARDNLNEVLNQLAEDASDEEDDDGKRFTARRRKAEALGAGSALAWVRRMEAASDLGTQQLYAVFRQYTIDVPKDATTLRCDDDGEIIEVPHPNAGTTVTCKDVVFQPPLAYTDDSWGEDATYSISGPDRADEELVKGMGGEWEVVYLSEPIDTIPVVKSAKRRRVYTTGIQVFTQRGLDRAKAALRRVSKAIEVDEEDTILLAQLDSILNAARPKTSRT